MVTLDVEGIRRLNLESKLTEVYTYGSDQFTKSYDALELALGHEIDYMARVVRLNKTLPDYLAYLHHIHHMDQAEVAAHISGVTKGKFRYSTSWVYGWFRKFGIPIRDKPQQERTNLLKRMQSKT